MVLALNTIWNEGNFELRIENYRDHWGQDIAPFQSAFIGARWVDKGRDRTVLTVRDPPTRDGAVLEPSSSASYVRRTAVLSFEDIRWQLIVKGDVDGGPVAVDVDGNKDFDLVVRADGQVLVRCLGGSFNTNDMQIVLRVPPFQGPLCGPSVSSADDACHLDAIPSSSSSALLSGSRHAHVGTHDGPASSGAVLGHSFPFDRHPSLASSCAHPPRQFPPASYAMSEISPDLAMLLEELRADQRAILQKEFQLVGASFGDRLWNGGRKLMGSFEPKEFLPVTALINVLVIPAIFLFTYLYNHRRRRRSLACSPLFPQPGTERRTSSSRSARVRRGAGDHSPSGCTTDGVAVARIDIGEDEDGFPPPPYYPG